MLGNYFQYIKSESNSFKTAMEENLGWEEK